MILPSSQVLIQVITSPSSFVLGMLGTAVVTTALARVWVRGTPSWFASTVKSQTGEETRREGRREEKKGGEPTLQCVCVCVCVCVLRSLSTPTTCCTMCVYVEVWEIMFIMFPIIK